MSVNVTYPNDEYLRRLGMITISFGDLEWSLGALLEVIVEPKSTLASVFSSYMSVSRLCNMISDTYTYQWPDCAGREQLEDLLRRCEEAEMERNVIVHSHCGFADSTSNKLLIRTRSTINRLHGSRHTRQNISISDLDQYLDELVDTVTRVMEFALWIMRTHQEGKNQVIVERPPIGADRLRWTPSPRGLRCRN
jgi:hypothetical protein